jgi:hypothetical protein
MSPSCDAADAEGGKQQQAALLGGEPQCNSGA